MKKLFFIKETIVDKITYYHLLFFAISLPYDRLYSELVLISLALHTLIHIRKQNLLQLKLSSLLVPVAIYLLTILGTIYTKFYNEAFYEWERQLAILLFPLIVLCNGFDFKKYCLNILLGLSLSCFLAIVYLYYSAFVIISYNHLPLSSIFNNAFINHNFSAPIDIHATYFSMYIALAAIALVIALLNRPGRIEKWIYLLILLVLMAGLVQLSSRAVLIALAIIINMVIPFLLIQSRKRIYFILITVVITLSGFYVLTRIDNLRTRFIIELKADLTQADINNNTLEPRVMRWNCALQLVQQSPVWGNGSGSEVALLKEVYYQRKFYNSYIIGLNAHSQYLSVLIKTGIIGFCILLYVYFAGFRHAIRYHDMGFAAFMVIIIVVSFSENILDGNKGIFFFSFFFSLFYLPQKRDEAVVIS